MAWLRGEDTAQDTDMRRKATDDTCSGHQKVHRPLWVVKLVSDLFMRCTFPHGLSQDDHSPAVGAGCDSVPRPQKEGDR